MNLTKRLIFFKQESTKEELCEYEEELKRQVDNHVRLEILTATISRQIEKNELTLTRMEENIVDLHELCGEMKESAKLAKKYLVMKKEFFPNNTHWETGKYENTLVLLREGKLRLSYIPFEKRIQCRHNYYFACEHDAKISEELYKKNLELLKNDLKQASDIPCNIDEKLINWLGNNDVIKSMQTW